MITGIELRRVEGEEGYICIMGGNCAPRDGEGEEGEGNDVKGEQNLL